MIYRRRLILDARLYVVSVFAILIGGRLLSLALPTEFYFTFQSLFSDRTAQNHAVALFSKMLAPAGYGFAAGWLFYSRARRTQKSFLPFGRRLRLQWSPTMFIAGISAALLSAWPMIVYWDLLTNPDVAALKLIFFVLYLVYMFAFGYVCLFGFLAALAVNDQLDGKTGTGKVVSFAELSRVGALWVSTSGIASTALKFITR